MTEVFWSLLDLYFDTKQYDETEFQSQYPLLANINGFYNSRKWGNNKILCLAIYAHANQEQKQYVEVLEANIQGGVEESELERCHQELKTYYELNRPARRT